MALLSSPSHLLSRDHHPGAQVTTKLDEHVVPEDESLQESGRGLNVLQDSLEAPQSKITTLSFKVLVQLLHLSL